MLYLWDNLSPIAKQDQNSFTPFSSATWSWLIILRMKWLSAGAGPSSARLQLHYFTHQRDGSWLPLLAVIPSTLMSTHGVPVPQPSLWPLDGALLCCCRSGPFCFTVMIREISAYCSRGNYRMSRLHSISLPQRVYFSFQNRDVAARRQEESHLGMKPNDLEIQIKFSCLLFSLDITDILSLHFLYAPTTHLPQKSQRWSGLGRIGSWGKEEKQDESLRKYKYSCSNHVQSLL